MFRHLGDSLTIKILKGRIKNLYCQNRDILWFCENYLKLLHALYNCAANINVFLDIRLTRNTSGFRNKSDSRIMGFTHWRFTQRMPSDSRTKVFRFNRQRFTRYWLSDSCAKDCRSKHMRFRHHRVMHISKQPAQRNNPKTSLSFPPCRNTMVQNILLTVHIAIVQKQASSFKFPPLCLVQYNLLQASILV